MIRFATGQIQPIGLDIGHDGVRMLQLQVTGQHLSVVASAGCEFAPEVRTRTDLRAGAAADAIRRMLRHHGFHGRRVVVAMPREMLHVKNLRLPAMPAQELAGAVQFEAANIFPFDAAEARLQFLPAGEIRHGNEVRHELIAMAARYRDIDDLLEWLHGCGVQVASIDTEATALYRTVERFVRRREDDQEVHVLVDLGARRGQVIIGRGRDIHFLKPLEIGGQHLNDALSHKLGISFDEARALRQRLGEAATDPANCEVAAMRDPVRQAAADATRGVLEQLAAEIELCLRYYSVTFRGHRPIRLRLLGGEASDPHVQSVLGAVLGVPVEAGRPLLSVDTSGMRPVDRRGAMSHWAMAMGLGLKLARGPFAPLDGKPRSLNVSHRNTAPRTADSVPAEPAAVNAAAVAEAPAAPAMEPYRAKSAGGMLTTSGTRIDPIEPEVAYART